jgi:hypothetical protein
MYFEILGDLTDVERIATGSGIREIARLRKRYGRGYEVSLEQRKIYVCIPDARVRKLGQLRVIDESGEEYLYPQESFVTADLSQRVRRAVLQAA